MWLLWAGVILLVLKLLAVEPIGSLHWGWIAGVFVLAFLWFDVIEARLGLNKRKAFDDLEKAKKERIRKALERDKKSRVRR